MAATFARALDHITETIAKKVITLLEKFGSYKAVRDEYDIEISRHILSFVLQR